MTGLRWIWGPSGRADRAVAPALGVLLSLGIGLRLALMLTRSPAFMGAWDPHVYISAARAELFFAPTWPVGYQLFLRGGHALSTSLSVTIALQHALGVATALLLFAIVRRAAPPRWALLPAGVVLLAGPQILLEHAVMSETLFSFLIALCCYCALRALDASHVRWAFATGLVGTAAGCVRPLGLLVVAIAVAWLIAARPGALRRRLLVGGTVALSAWLLLAGYVVLAKSEAGYIGPGLSRAGGWAVYMRVAPFADCSRFSPPTSARALCESRPISRRPASIQYLQPSSPAVRAYGSFIGTSPDGDRALTAFARTAILHQPLDYARAVGADVARLWSSDIRATAVGGDSYDLYSTYLEGISAYNVNEARRWYSTVPAHPRPGVPGALEQLERRTRLEGLPLALLVALVLAGLPFARGRRLAVGLFMAAVSVALLVGSIATLFYYPRYVVPGYGPLAAAGAIGGAALWERVTAWRPQRRRQRAGTLEYS